MKKLKEVGQSFVIACSMYSKIPMPKQKWEKESMEYIFCFFPVVGVFIGAAIMGWTFFAHEFLHGTNLWAVGYVLIPLLLSGGIHMDGFMDTTDARSSFQPREKKLEILKDPNAGAFAVIGSIIYVLLQFGVWSELIAVSLPEFDFSSPIISGTLILTVGHVLVRALSGLFVVSVPAAKNSGLAALFSGEANKKITKWVTVCISLCSAVSMFLIDPWMGGAAVLGMVCVCIYYKYRIIPEFGGITGDLAGYFLQVGELAMAVFVLLSVLVR